VKIIKEGKLPQNKVHRHTCKNCQTIFEYFKWEATKGVYNECKRSCTYTIACPFCQTDCSVDPDYVPNNMSYKD
jgi:hypothetical protein